MADLISVQVTDAAGNVKSIAIPVAAGLSIANIQTNVDTLLPFLDAAIDGLITKVSITKDLTVVAGLKNTAANNQVHEGALLSYDAAGTPYKFSLFIPSWSDAGFSGNSVDNSGVYNAFITKMDAGFGAAGGGSHPTDKYDDDLTGFTGGTRRFRK